MSLKDFDMAGRVALITGASSRGIGSSAAKVMASDASAWVTGQTIIVDGGQLS